MGTFSYPVTLIGPSGGGRETLEKVLMNAKAAIELYLEVLLKGGKAVLRDEEVVYKVTVAT